MTTAIQTLSAAADPRPFLPFRSLIRRLQALSSLSPLSDAHLRDIGLTRSDIHALRDLPLSADVTTRLQISASRRPGTW